VSDRLECVPSVVNEQKTLIH